MLIAALYIIYVLGVPLAVMNLARRWKWIEKISPMTVLYLIGLVVANSTPFLNVGKSSEINTTIGNLAVPLALPMMLMGCNIRKWSTRLAFKAFVTGLISVMAVIVVGFFLFKEQYDSKQFAQISALLTALYTGGIPNIGSVAKGVGVSNELYLYVTSYDLVVTGVYLMFIIFFGKRVFRKLLPPKIIVNETVEVAKDTSGKVVFPFDRIHWQDSIKVIGVTIVIAVISYVIAMLASTDGDLNMTVLILLLTTLSIGASFTKPMEKQESSFDMGLYCIYVFCFTIANGCDVRAMDFRGSLNILWMVAFVIFGSLVLQIILAKIFKIDGDTVLVSSVSLINSPPFVPMVAAILGNKEVMMTGICVGVLGYIVGNYLGIGVFLLLSGM